MSNNFKKITKGITLVPQTVAPTSPTNGDVYYDSTLGFLGYTAGAWGALGGTGGSSTTTHTYTERVTLDLYGYYNATDQQQKIELELFGLPV